MKSERWRLVSPHLDQVLDLSGVERQRHLEDLASEHPTLAADLVLLLGEERALRDEEYLEHDVEDLLAESPLAAGVPRYDIDSTQIFQGKTMVRIVGADMGNVFRPPHTR